MTALQLTRKRVVDATVLSCEHCGDGGWEPNSGYPEPCSGCGGQGVYGNAPWTIGAIQVELRADWLVLHAEVERWHGMLLLITPLAFLLGILGTLLWLSTIGLRAAP